MKIACCSTLNDRYLDGFLTFFYSLQKHTPNFNYPYYIFEWGELSDASKEFLNKIYPHFIFKSIDNSAYEGCTYDTEWRTWDINCINRFDIFTLTEYDRVVFLDVDMLVLKDITELFTLDVDFGAVAVLPILGSVMDHPGSYDKSITTFDGGLMVISSKYLNDNTKRDLIKIAFQKKWSSDEPILNVYFTNDKTTFLPKEYNILVSELTPDLLNSAKIIQFVGHNKPWIGTSLNTRYDDHIFKVVSNLPFIMQVDFLYQRYYNEAKKLYGC